MTASARRDRGFTLVELVMVITVIGALALLVLPRALDLGAWRLHAYGDTLRAELAAAERLSLQQRRPVVVTFDTTGVVIAYGAGGAIATLPCPAATSPCIAEAGSRSCTFNSGHSGRHLCAGGSALPVTLAHGGTRRAWVLEDETGLFRPAP